MTFKSTRREQQARKQRHSTRTSRTFLHTLDRLAAERDRDATRRSARRQKAGA